MNTDIEFLRTLEEDLEAAAARETERETSPLRSQTAGAGSRRLALYERRWPQVAAAVVVLLVMAGGIGVIAQRHTAGTASGDAVSAPGVGANDRQQSFVHNGVVIDTPGARDVTSGSSGGASKTSVSGSDLSKIVRTGSISVQVVNGTFTKTAVPAVYKVASDAGGFVLSSTTKSGVSGTFTLRIPSRRFDTAMTALTAIGTVQASESSGKDVTAQYVDYQARLRILLGRRAVVFGLLSKATTIAQTLQLQSDFDKVELQIEQFKGQLNVLRNQVAESTIQVDLAEKDTPEPAPPSPVHTPSLFTSWRLAWQGFVRVIGAVIVGLGYVIPVGVIAGAIWGVTALGRRRRAAKSAP
jgi:hypothetical protein